MLNGRQCISPSWSLPPSNEDLLRWQATRRGRNGGTWRRGEIAGKMGRSGKRCCEAKRRGPGAWLSSGAEEIVNQTQTIYLQSKRRKSQHPYQNHNQHLKQLQHPKSQTDSAAQSASARRVPHVAAHALTPGCIPAGGRRWEVVVGPGAKLGVVKEVVFCRFFNV